MYLWRYWNTRQYHLRSVSYIVELIKKSPIRTFFISCSSCYLITCFENDCCFRSFRSSMVWQWTSGVGYTGAEASLFSCGKIIFTKIYRVCFKQNHERCNLNSAAGFNKKFWRYMVHLGVATRRCIIHSTLSFDSEVR